MTAQVIRLTAQGMCEARTQNDLLVVFRTPAEQELRLGDMLEFDNLAAESDVVVAHTTRGGTFVVHIANGNIHDLRLPGAHGASREPSFARLRGA